MTIQAYCNDRLFDRRVYFDFEKNLKYTELKHSICPVKKLEYKGAGIRCYRSFIGWILHFLSLATKVNVDGKIFYLNNKSVCQYVIRRCEAHKILKDYPETDKIKKHAEIILRMDDLYRRSHGLGYPQWQVDGVGRILKEILPSGAVDDTDKLDELFTVLHEIVEKLEKPIDHIEPSALPVNQLQLHT